MPYPGSVSEEDLKDLKDLEALKDMKDLKDLKDLEDLKDLKDAAVEFYRRNRVPQELERALQELLLHELLLHEPRDIFGHLANHFRRLSAPPAISRLKGREVYDAGGQPTVEAELFCLVCNQEKSLSSASTSSHCGPNKALLDGTAASQRGADQVTTAVRWIDGPLNDLLRARNPCDQSQVDHILSDFFAARYLEEEEIRGKMAERRSPDEPAASPPSPPPAQPKVKKNGDKSKKSNALEKPVPPADVPEPVLPGSLAVGSVSLAVAKAGARTHGVPLYKHIAALKNGETPTQFHIPVSMVTVLSCGKNSPGRLALLEEVILIPPAGRPVKQIITMTLELQKEMMRIISGATKAEATQVLQCDGGAPAVGFDRPEQPLDLISEACANVGVALGTDVHLALSCAAPELMEYSKGKYEVSTGVLKSPDELVDLYQTLIGKYPAVVALIDPFRREDAEQWEMLSHAIGDSCALLSDITYKSKAPPLPGVRGHIVKQVHETTVSDLIRIASDHQGSVLMGTARMEPCSSYSLADIAVGLGLDYVKLGGLSGAERMTKYNRLISIEEELAQQGILASRERRSPLFGDKPRSSTAESPASDTATP